MPQTVTTAQKLGGGLSEQITEFLDEHPQTKLIVIDTLQYIRNTGKFTGTYSGDYHDMDALRAIIAERDLTMLLVTHNHKSDDVDPVNRVVGSSGLTGAVDGIFILENNKRIGDSAKLTIANRDTEGHQFDLRFDRQDCRWQFVTETGVENNKEVSRIGVNINQIVKFANANGGIYPQEIAALQERMDEIWRLLKSSLSEQR